MLELLIPMLIAAVLGTGYAAVFLFYNREKKKEGCSGETGGHGFGCVHCGACGGKDLKKNEPGFEASDEEKRTKIQ
ncbi:MAG: hypothetical protein A2008_11240 [Candidatus Wallbacteria bacterium GWC2_49_35]|uniref:Uncharacterized protein n=1 Tax=Candidatus Wallbacteria bacterium GWC2_49_35 TaxID=1817813 RepID=A0A1F7WU31_9BACT|nr:MAG: hypothetical protein A2008_11240 [Candidatus Wallbacteria bacterium GWC2_49_35]HBC73755.1 hypothetical protein [Candidatus Wallbacteria bacterium]